MTESVYLSGDSEASDYKPISENQQGISKWEITFSLTESVFATGNNQVLAVLV